MTLWSPIETELSLWQSEGLDLPLWWRDDDAVASTPALDQLVQLSTALSLPVHLAIIPAHADDTLTERVTTTKGLVPVVHGWAHTNHAPAGQKKSEFGTPRANAATDAARGLERLRETFGGRLVPLFVPPWNRVDAALVGQLTGLGYRGLSTYTPRRAAHVAPGLCQINTHIDPIWWRGGGGLVDPETQIARIVTLLRDRRAGRTDRTEPLGILTHHLVQDQATWQFTRDCLRCLLDNGAHPADIAATIMQDEQTA